MREFSMLRLRQEIAAYAVRRLFSSLTREKLTGNASKNRALGPCRLGFKAEEVR
jgi:hypothetical protein